jgi:hypothetical protein
LYRASLTASRLRTLTTCACALVRDGIVPAGPLESAAVRVSLSLTVDRKSCNSYCIGQASLAAEIAKFVSCTVPAPIDVILHDRLKAARVS